MGTERKTVLSNLLTKKPLIVHYSPEREKEKKFNK